MPDQRYSIVLSALPQEGHLLHMVADFEIIDNCLKILTVCGRIFEPSLLVDVPSHQVQCQRCKSVAVQYGHRVGYRRTDTRDVVVHYLVDDIPF